MADDATKPARNQRDTDRRFMDAALRFARQNEGRTGTNPSVACLIVDTTASQGRIIGRGVTALGGRPHAEPLALEEAGSEAAGATAYVTLEPCAHHGRTPPCAQTLIDAGIKRVVTAITDPDARVCGKGHEMLREAAIEVEILDCAETARQPIKGYLAQRNTGKPYVTLKVAMTENGAIGERGRGNVRITGPVSKAQVHLMRARHDAILVGSGTLNADDPSLDCRLPGLEDRSPIRVVLDHACSLKPQNKVLASARDVPTLAVAPGTADADWIAMIKASGAQWLPCELHEGHIALPELLDDLAARGIQSVMVEGGAGILASFVTEGLADEIVMFVGAKPDMVATGDEAIRVSFTPLSPPSGFVSSGEWSFGGDQCFRFVKGT